MSDLSQNKIFSMDNSMSVLTGNSLEKNIQHLEKHYGTKFIIKCGQIELPVVLHKKGKSYKTVYTLYYNYGDKRYDTMLPLLVDIEPDSNVAYIANIHKAEAINVSGSNIVILCLNFLKTIGVEFVYLSDYAHIECKQNSYNFNGASLSLFKLIEKGRTFYQKFGFKLYDIPQELALYYGSEKQAQKKLLKYVDKFRRIKVSDVIKMCANSLTILFHVIKKRDYANIEFIVYNDVHVRPENISAKCEATIGEINYILDSLLQTEHKYLYQYLIETFNNDCVRYLRLEDLIFYNLLNMIKYKQKKVKFMYREIMNHILTIMGRCKYALHLKDFNMGCT